MTDPQFGCPETDVSSGKFKPRQNGLFDNAGSQIGQTSIQSKRGNKVTKVCVKWVTGEV